MRFVLVLFFALNCLFSFSQGINLGTTFFENDRYLISFDKVIYPGYILKIENLKKREYLMGKLVQDSSFWGSWEIPHEYQNNDHYYLPDIYTIPCITVELNDVEECLDLSGNIKILENKIYKEEYDLSVYFKIYISPSATIKRINKDSTKVDVIKIEYAVDSESKKLVQKERIQETRNISNKEVTDSEGNVYQTTTIGNHTWLAENLRSTKFNNGIEIPNLSESQWANSTAPGIVSLNLEGNFYNFYTLASEYNVCPQGFHVPSHYDIAYLYNYITPYGDFLKITGNKVKINNYSPRLAPIVVPYLSTINLSRWAVAGTLDVGLIGLTIVSDVSLLGLQASAAVIDASLISPFFGWKGKKRQKKENTSRSKQYKFIDSNGIPFSKTNKGYEKSDLKPIDKEEWKNFIVLESFINDSLKTEYRPILDLNRRDSLKNAHSNFEYKLKYDPFVLSQLYAGKFFITSNWLFESYFFKKINKLLKPFNILPFSKFNGKSELYYQRSNYKSSFGRFDHQPVVTLLLNKGENEFANEYGFNLNFDNAITFPKNIRNGNIYSYPINKKKFTGISYIDDYGLPAYFGLNEKNKLRDHELNLLENIWDEGISELNLYRMQTRVRCVKH